MKLALVLACACSAAPVHSAHPWEASRCDGFSPAVDAELTRLESPVRDHCERHGGVLYVRTMNTTAHDDAGAPLPACRWEVFAGSGVHVATLESCELTFAGRCVTAGGARQCY
ncbi:MAG TPA: hypothetical protein VGM88_14975 [Kofleriaceae bacterium]